MNYYPALSRRRSGRARLAGARLPREGPHHRRHRPRPHARAANSSPARTWSCWNRWPVTSASPSRTRSLYASLEEKIIEYERLKEFNENIVESINVGIFALDLEERIESWNSQMEVMFALPRKEALRPEPRSRLPGGTWSRNSPRERSARRAQPLQVPPRDPR